MQATLSFKLAFLRHMLVGLRLCGVSAVDDHVSVLERKRAIKDAADMAMAAARGGGARWSRALAAGLSAKRRIGKARAGMTCCGEKILRRSYRLARSCRARKATHPPAPRRAASASVVARRMVKKRIQVLRRLVPGGEAMEGCALWDETLDYVISLRAQVDVMRRLADALRMTKDSKISHPECNLQEKRS